MLSSNKNIVQDGFTHGMMAQVAQYCKGTAEGCGGRNPTAWIYRLEEHRVLITMEQPTYAVPPAMQETISASSIPAGCVYWGRQEQVPTSNAAIHYQLQWTNATDGWTELRPTETIVGRTVHFEGTFFRDVTVEAQMRDPTVSRCQHI